MIMDDTLKKLNFALLTGATCGDACWHAREDICRCSCGGKNHGILLGTDGKQPTRTRKIGGKFYEYIRLKKPILGIVPPEGEAARAIRETDSGLVVSDTQVNTIMNTLKQFLNSQIIFSWSGIYKFNRKKQAEKLNKFLIDAI